MKERLKKLKSKLLKQNNEMMETKNWVIEQIVAPWSEEDLKEKQEEVNFIASFGEKKQTVEITEMSYKYDLLRQYADLFTEEERQDLRNKIAGLDIKSK
jgi:hypothetical protein